MPEAETRSGVGQPIRRRDGIAKVTGAARYAADRPVPGLLHAVLAVSGIARGRLKRLDIAAAKTEPGVIEVMTSANRPALAIDPDAPSASPFGTKLDLLQTDEIRYAAQPIAVVIGETLEAATEGARRLAPQYDAVAPIVDLETAERFVPKAVGAGGPPAFRLGDVAAGLATSVRQVEAVCETAPHYHNPIEAHVVIASWEGDRLTLDMPTQGLALTRARIAELLGLAEADIHIRSEFLGGAFGSKGLQLSPQILGILAARLVGRPVKLVLAREQMYGPVAHRAATRQTLRLGADEAGSLRAIDHRVLTYTSSFDDFIEPAADISRILYASPAIATAYEAVRLDVGTPMFMRAPGHATGSLALECAIDEMAWSCGMDPLAFRLRNYAETEPGSGRPFSSKALRECYAAGSDRFGWASRPLAPRRMRDAAGLLVGWGVGTATLPSHMFFQGQARALLRSDGSACIESGVHDMGQGAGTALAQIAADALGLPVGRIEFRLGDSRLPDAGFAAASSHTVTAGLAIHAACQDAVSKLMHLAAQAPTSPLFGAGNARIVAQDGRLHLRDDPGRGESYADIVQRAGLAEIEGVGRSAPDPAARAAYAMHAHGAVFAEVKVDPDLGQLRVTRLVGAFAAGRIVNPRLARSQCSGGMIWGLSLALHEGAVTDRGSGRILNADLSEYRVPVHADIGAIETLLIEEPDAHVNALGVKGGVGEIGPTGTAGAIANAVWHATGRRIRRFPLTPEQLL